MLAERVPLTALITLLTTLFTFAMAIPIGIYSATHQYSLTDYSVATVGFIGLATPNFLLALILMFLFSRWFGVTIGGLFSPEMVTESFSLAKLWDLDQAPAGAHRGGRYRGHRGADPHHARHHAG